MAKYNTKVSKPQNVVENKQGGTGLQFKPEMELVGLLASGLEGHFYEKENERETRLIQVIKEVGKKDPELVAKALVYARTIMGQRSVTHVGSVAALSVLSGNPLGTRFFTKRERKANKGGIIFRLDDMLEIISYYFLRNPGKPLPNSIKRGFKSALETADAYELAKYQGKGKSVSLVDVVNLVHPKPSEKMQETFKQLMKGELKQFNTAEDKQTKAGQEVAEKVKSGSITKAEAEVELKEAKAENWKDLINDGTIGYLALLRNLRNIVEQTSDAVFKSAMILLTDEKRVRKSLVFPHQIDIAFEVLLSEGNFTNSSRKNDVLKAVNEAYELAIPNLTELFTYGRSAVVIDTSGSMTTNVNMGTKRINSRAVDKAALIGATFAKGIGADMYHFSDQCAQLTYNPLDTVNTIKNVVVNRRFGGGTSFNTIFSTLKGKYDRVFVISDMQGGDSILGGSSYQAYVNKNGQPFVYSVNLCGYSTTMFKQNQKLINLFGYSSDIYEMVKQAEINPEQILKEIRKIEI
jgi:hypothetical protein